ncbi:hypothetical protein IAU59_005904 [Kwoniella sp. CBS 9459]
MSNFKNSDIRGGGESRFSGGNQGFTRAIPVSKKNLGLDPSSDEIDSVVVHDLHWWTNDQHLVDLCDEVGFKVDLKNVQFLEHKVNGKSKGQAAIKCPDKAQALKLNEYLQAHPFQGKEISCAFASSAGGNPLHPGNQDFPVVRPLSTAIHSTVRHPTNAHGGVNFNRVRPNSRSAIHANLGMGHPAAAAAAAASASRTFTMGDFNPQGNMIPAMMPIDPAIAWSSQQGEVAPHFGYAPPGHPQSFQFHGQDYINGMLPSMY